MFSKVNFHLKIGSRFYKLRGVNNCVKCRATQFVYKVCCHKVLMFCSWRNATWQKVITVFISKLLKSQYHELHPLCNVYMPVYVPSPSWLRIIQLTRDSFGNTWF